VATVPNVYAYELYSFPAESPTAVRKPRPIESFNIDAYEYPPPFLLLPRTLAILVPDFLHFRVIWFALNGAVLVIGLVVVARMLGPMAGTRAFLLAPLILASDLTIGTLQIGNLQAIVFSIAMIAMVLLVQRRYAAGGALLAFVTVSKLFPSLLLIYLLVRREWRALAWTSGMIAALVVISLLDTGWLPIRRSSIIYPGCWGVKLSCLSQPSLHCEELFCSRHGIQTSAVRHYRRVVCGNEDRRLDLHLGCAGPNDHRREADVESRRGTAGVADNPDFGVAA